jgi:hypothetical protein
MVGVFREGHTKRPSRRHEPLIIGPPAVSWKRRFAIGLVLVGAATAALLLFSKVAQAHPSPHVHAQVLERPIAGVRNNYWYDYRSDIEEAEIELRKDLRRAITAQDEREAWAEYHRELRDARSDYRKEMAERGYIARRGRVTVGN